MQGMVQMASVYDEDHLTHSRTYVMLLFACTLQRAALWRRYFLCGKSGEAGVRPALSRNCIPVVRDRGARTPASTLFSTTFAAKEVERNLEFIGCLLLPLPPLARGFLF